MNHIDLSRVVYSDGEWFKGYILVNNIRYDEIDINTGLKIVEDCDNTCAEKIEFLKLITEKMGDVFEDYYAEVISNLYFYIYLYIHYQDGSERDICLLYDMQEARGKLQVIMRYFETDENYHSTIIDNIDKYNFNEYRWKGFDRFINLAFPNSSEWKACDMDGEYENPSKYYVDESDWTIEHLIDDSWFKRNIVDKYAKRERLRRL